MAKPAKTPRKIILSGIAGLIAIIIIGVAYVQLTQPTPEQPYQAPEPEEVVRLYFESWGRNDWPNMYATISDGFKAIDPDAKDLAALRNFASSQGVEGINILGIKEILNDGATADVEYSVEFALADGKRQFSDRFTLKYRQGDIIPGWKLIHPYGTNIDTA